MRFLKDGEHTINAQDVRAFQGGEAGGVSNDNSTAVEDAIPQQVTGGRRVPGACDEELPRLNAQAAGNLAHVHLRARRDDDTLAFGA